MEMMGADPVPSTSNGFTSDHSVPQPVNEQHDLTGGPPFTVIESDPGVFTRLTRTLGIKGLEVVELYAIEPWAVDHLNPRGLVFCFLWHNDSNPSRPTDFDDPTAAHIWFANQVNDDACASQAILNVALNCPDVDIGDALAAFRTETEQMSAVMKGLAISNSPLVRNAHNSLARPADLRAALRTVSKSTLEESRKVRATKPKAKAKTNTKATEIDNQEETYHFIGYVPAHGKVWELDGLKSGPLEVGELPSSSSKGWMDVVRPALRMKMRKYGGGEDGDIRFCLLALVDDHYQAASDTLELLKREKLTLERRLEDAFPDGWNDKVDPAHLSCALEAFTTSVQSSENGRMFACDAGSKKMDNDLDIFDLPVRALADTWGACVNNGMEAKMVVEEEIGKSVRAQTDHVKRTHDYEPFIKGFIESLYHGGLLYALLDRDNDGKKVKKSTAKVKR